MMNHNTNEEKIRHYSKKIVGPVMFSYVEWILNEAQKRKLERIYFLARDGFLLYKIAQRICKERKINIDCRYFYCSRQSLRMPSYHIIGDEAFDLLLLGGYHITPRSLLERAMLEPEETDEILSELNVENPLAALSERELMEISAKIRENQRYKDAVTQRSRRAYAETIEYFRQEGFFECKNLAIADSGWTGSMQRSIRQLLQNEGFDGSITGFYFGMYVEPKDEADGDYLTFYFDGKSGAKRKASFNNNLFECMLSANHPMTVGYESRDGKTVPVFTKSASEDMISLINAQISGALEFTDGKLKESFESFDYEKELRKVYKILKRAMVYPSRDFATVYGSFAFCDDVTEGYHMTLADPKMRKALRSYMLIPRIYRKLFKQKKKNSEELFWPYGVIAFCPALLRFWYRANVKAWEILKAIRSR